MGRHLPLSPPSVCMAPARVWWGHMSAGTFSYILKFEEFKNSLHFTYLPRDLVSVLKKPYSLGGCNSINIFQF